MRFGGPVFKKCNDAKEWVAAVKASGYSAAFCPLKTDTDSKTIQSYEQASLKNDVVIAEVGAWSNPLSPDKKTAKTALLHCKKSLALAEAVGARCCVNIAGSRGVKWDGPSSLDLTTETFEMIVAKVRCIIDAVKPKRTFYALETMPWMYPNSPEVYLDLIKAIDRKQFAVHFDPVNMINSPEKYFKNAEIIKTFVKKLGKYIKSCHAKDIKLQENLTTHLDEVRPGLGNLDYRVYLKEIDGLSDRNLPVLLEHLPNEREYLKAAEFFRSKAKAEGISLQ